MNSVSHNTESTDDVLDLYLQLFEERGDLTDHVFSNTVLDWFGRTVRGSERVKQFVRYQVIPRFGHSNFGGTRMCAAIEQRPTHTKTMEIIDHDGNLSSHGKTSLSFHSTSGIAGINRESMPSTSNTNNSNSPNLDNSHFRDSAEELNKTIPAKRIKRDHDNISASEFSNFHQTGLDQGMESPIYGPLQYIETTGELKTRDNNGSMHQQRDVRIRISFRRKINDGHIFFSLIMYEHKNNVIEVSPRRNLLCEFDKTADEVEMETEMDTEETFYNCVNSETTNIGDLEDTAIVALRTPTKMSRTSNVTPKRNPRVIRVISNPRLFTSNRDDHSRRKVARNLRL